MFHTPQQQVWDIAFTRHRKSPKKSVINFSSLSPHHFYSVLNLLHFRWKVNGQEWPSVINRLWNHDRSTTVKFHCLSIRNSINDAFVMVVITSTNNKYLTLSGQVLPWFNWFWLKKKQLKNAYSFNAYKIPLSFHNVPKRGTMV